MSVSAQAEPQCPGTGTCLIETESITVYIYADKAAQIVSLLTALRMITLLYIIALKILLTAYQSTRSQKNINKKKERKKGTTKWATKY